jgi:hypothetical protein
MAINTSPIFTAAPVVGPLVATSASITTRQNTGLAALTASAATPAPPVGFNLVGGTINTDYFNIFTADANYGSYVQKIRWRASIAAASSTGATVCRVFISNGATLQNTTGASPFSGTCQNYFCYDEISLPTVTGTATAATALFELPMNIAIPPGAKIYIAYPTAVLGGFDVSVYAGNYTAQ